MKWLRNKYEITPVAKGIVVLETLLILAVTAFWVLAIAEMFITLPKGGPH